MARGREASTTMSARSSRPRSARTPSWQVRSSATLCLPSFIRSKNGRDPARAPSGRRVLSTLTTRAPARRSSCVQSGPAQSADRSTTRGVRRGRWVLVPSCRTRHQGGASRAGGVARAAASPSRRARSTASSAARPRRRAPTHVHGSPSTAPHSQAGSSSRSSGRVRLTARKASEAASSRQVPPGAIWPRRSSSSSAARSPRSAGPSRPASSARPLQAASTWRAARAALAKGAGASRGGPAWVPVSAMAPERAQSMAASGASRTGVDMRPPSAAA